MPTLLKKTVVALLICSFLPSLSIASETWYQRHAEGWHWYNEPERVEEVEETESISIPEEKTPNIPQPKQIVPTPEKVGPVAFSSAWLEEMIPKYLSNAVDDPTPENVEAFFILQRLAMDKAERFQKVAEQVRVGNKFIDESERRPTSTFGLQTIDRDAEARRNLLLQKISKMAGLFFFFKEGCQFCEKQAPILKHIESKGFDVLAISIGGGKLHSAHFENEVIDSGQAEMLSVESTPSLFLVHPQSTTFALIGSSLLSVPDIEERIILIAQRNNWVSEEEVNETRPRLRSASGVDLSKKLPEMMKAVQEDPNKLADLMALLDGRDAVAERKHLTELPETQKRSLMDSNGFIEPKTLLQIMKAPESSTKFKSDASDVPANFDVK